VPFEYIVTHPNAGLLCRVSPVCVLSRAGRSPEGSENHLSAVVHETINRIAKSMIARQRQPSALATMAGTASEISANLRSRMGSCVRGSRLSADGRSSESAGRGRRSLVAQRNASMPTSCADHNPVPEKDCP
jgi:hypothetical protein